jgi:hypothetical protein
MAPNLMSLLDATILTAIATVALAVGAIVTAVFAVLAFRKQSQEVRAIQRQVVDQQELTRHQAELLEVQSGLLGLQRQQFDDQLAERRRAQATCVFIWTEIGPDPRRTDEQLEKGVPWYESITTHVWNTSGLPIHSLTIAWYANSDLIGDPNSLPILLPGESDQWTRALELELSPETELSQVDVVAHFRDAAGVHWRMTPGDPPGPIYGAGIIGLTGPDGHISPLPGRARYATEES